MINKSFLKQYDYYMEKVINNATLYKGCFLLLIQMYQTNVYFDDTKYPPFVIINELYSYFLKPNGQKNPNFHLWKQLNAFICTFVITKYKQFTKDEWINIFQLLSNAILCKGSDNDSFLQVYKCFSQNFEKLKTNQAIINSFKNLKKYLKIK